MNQEFMSGFAMDKFSDPEADGAMANLFADPSILICKNNE